MNEREFAEKSIRLSFELTKHLIKHPELEQKIPEGAEVVILLEDDPEFNKRARELALKSEEEGQQVVFLKVEQLAPPSPSRLIKPELVGV